MRFRHLLAPLLAAALAFLCAGSAFAQAAPTTVAVKNASGSTVNVAGQSDASGNFHYRDVFEGLSDADGLTPMGIAVSHVNDGLDVNVLTLPSITITNTSFAISGTLPAFASTPTFNVGNWPSIWAVTGTFWQSVQPVSGTFWQATQPVSLAAAPLPSGAATGANQTATQAAAGSSSASATGVQGVAGGVAVGTSDSNGGAIGTGYSPPSGGSGFLGYLSGIYHALTGTLTVSVSGTVTANAGSNLNTSALALETGGNLATTATNTGTSATNTGTTNTDFGAPGATACATDTASCSLNQQMQRVAQRLSSMIAALNSPFQAGASIGNVGFNALQGGTANSVSNPFYVDPGTGATFAVTGTFWQSTQPISAASLPLPTGAMGSTGGTVGLVAGSAIIGKVDIDQTTPGTTNGVQTTSGSVTASTQSGAWNVGGLTGVSQTATLTRASNTTAYTGNQLVCAFTSSTVCAPLQPVIAGASAATGTLGRVILAKSGASLTGATFTLWLFSAAPTTASLFDASAYVGPYAADLPTYLGSYLCNAMQATNDGTAQAFSECVPSNPQGWLQYKTLSGQAYVDVLITVTGAYTPASAETFKVYMNSLQDK